MIQIESVRIAEFRGIRELEFSPGRRNYLVSGPNGSGKSGVVDAIQFGLTGEISRLAGKGTGTLTVQKHGPHVDRRDDPAMAEVSLTLYFTELEKTAVLTRNIKTAKKFELSPDDPAVRSVLKEVAGHPELTLSRREIIKYILVEAGERSKEIQELLRLEEIGNIRSVLRTASNKVSISYKIAQKNTANDEDLLRRHLEVETLTNEGILSTVNTHRQVLDLPIIDELTPDTVLNTGVAESGLTASFNKNTAIIDVDALRTAQAVFAEECTIEVATILADIAKLEADPSLLEALRQRTFVEHGLALVDGPRCPLCDVEWDDEEHLRKHLQYKLTKSKEAEAIQRQLVENATVIAVHARRIAALVEPVRVLASSYGPAGFENDLAAWADDLMSFTQCLTTAEDVFGQKTRFEQGWRAVPDSLVTNSTALFATIQGKPDQIKSTAANSFLTLSQDRMDRLWRARKAEKHAQDAARIGELTYSSFCDVSDEHFTALYEVVENDFSNFYREINSDDESEFRATFEPSEGKLDFEVAFFDRGMYPPVAYHSEGHQDGMGVCLYLALMKRQLGSRFRFAVLDDVVMSVDQDHRKEFCRLLKTSFPNTQFIVTTHDRVWAKQMQTEGLIERKSGMVIQSWSVQTGPIFEQITEVWDQIEADLLRNDIGTAASRLRRHLEFISGEVADQLGARLPYRGDFTYDLGDLLPAVIGRQRELLKLAATSAQSWKDAFAMAKVDMLKKTRSEVLKECDGEQWVINKAIHFNDWASFTKVEFQAVAAVFKALILQFRCPELQCDSWYYVTPKKGEPEALRCRCMALNLNLRSK